MTLNSQSAESKPSGTSTNDGILSQMTGSAGSSGDLDTRSSPVKKIEFSSTSTMRLIHPELDISLVMLIF